MRPVTPMRPATPNGPATPRSPGTPGRPRNLITYVPWILAALGLMAAPVPEANASPRETPSPGARANLHAPAKTDAPTHAKEVRAAVKRARADAVFPLYLGTTWTYRRTVQRGTGPALVTEETRKIVSIEPTASKHTFKVTLDQGGSFFVNSGGVFDSQCDRGGGCSLQPLYPLPAKGQTSFRTLYGGDVSLTVSVKTPKMPVVTRAGAFTSCFELHFPISASGRQVVFCRGVGVVQDTFVDTIYGGGAAGAAGTAGAAAGKGAAATGSSGSSQTTSIRLELIRFRKGS